MRRISLLGSTGSIGTQSLDVISACGMTVAALTANRDVERMEEQCRRFRPELAGMMDPAAAAELRLRLADTPVRVASGMEGLLEAAHTGGSATAVLNGANEAAVGQFLSGRLPFDGIARQVAHAMERVPAVPSPSLEDILEADRAARAAVEDHRIGMP